MSIIVDGAVNLKALLNMDLNSLSVNTAPIHESVIGKRQYQTDLRKYLAKCFSRIKPQMFCIVKKLG